VLVALADTHGRTDLRLTDHLREVVAAADCVLHAGDFTSAAVLDSFADLADQFVAVHGNSDDAAVQARLPAVETVEAFERRLLLVHGHEHDRTALSLLARQERADVVVLGHTHAPGTEELGELTVVTPGSHADPRRSRPAYATFEGGADGPRGRLRTPDGEPFVAVQL
jgi:phosphoesterase, MJ0936 family